MHEKSAGAIFGAANFLVLIIAPQHSRVLISGETKQRVYRNMVLFCNLQNKKLSKKKEGLEN